ncbi:MAG: hypothetical protein ACRCYT_00460 [Cetobacterium sp.]
MFILCETLINGFLGKRTTGGPTRKLEVPPLLAKAVAQSILDVIKKI